MNSTTTAATACQVQSGDCYGAQAPHRVRGDGAPPSEAPEATPSVPQSKTETQPVIVNRAPGAKKSSTQSPAAPLNASVPSANSPSTRSPSYIRRQRAIALVVAGVLALIVSAGGAWYWQQARAWVKTDNAYVSAHIHTVSARVSGTIQQVLVEENQTVEAGSLLARFDARDFEVAREQAAARLAQARAQVQQAEAQIAQAQAQIQTFQARANKAKQDFARAQSLFEGSAGAISHQEYDLASAEYEAAKAALDGAQAAQQSAFALASAARAQEQVAQAALKDADLQLSYTELRAPTAGRIGRKNLETGNRVQPGQALLALVQSEVWVTANFKETQLARMQPGQTARIRLDAFPGREFAGKLESFSPASGAQFALLPPDNATGNFTRIVQRIPVRIVFTGPNLGDCGGRIVPGMSTLVEIKVR